MAELSLYDRLGGAFAIAAVVDHFSQAIVQNPIVGQKSENPRPSGMAHQQSGQAFQASNSCALCGSATLPADPSNMQLQTRQYSLGLEEAHRELKISPAEFDEVAAELGRTLDFFKVPEREKEVLAAFAAHKGEVTEGYSQ
jgi:hemoglobin